MDMSSSGCMNKPELLNKLNHCVLPKRLHTNQWMCFMAESCCGFPQTATTFYSDASDSYVHRSVC